MKKMKKLLLITLVLCMVFSIPVSAKSKKKLGFDEYFDIYVEYFGNLIDPAYSMDKIGMLGNAR